MRRVSRRGLFFAGPLLLLALSASAATGPAAARTKPVKLRTLAITEGIQTFAQDGNEVAWICSQAGSIPGFTSATCPPGKTPCSGTPADTGSPCNRPRWHSPGPASSASDLAIGTGGVVYRVGRAIYTLRAGRPALLWRARVVPIGLSIEGRRVAWAANGVGGSRIVALTLR